MGLRFCRGDPRAAEVGDQLAGSTIRIGCLPSHGPSVRQPEAATPGLSEKLERLERLYVRGYGVEGGSVAYQDKVSRPTAIPDVLAGLSAPVQVQAARTSGRISG